MKRNKVLNNGGVDIRGHTTNVVVEGNVITNSSVGVHVDRSQATHVYVTGNTPRVEDPQ